MTHSAESLAHAPDDRISWRLNAERLTVLGWGRAVLLQLAHPHVAAGVAQHSIFGTSPLDRVRRFRRTLDAMLLLTYGTEDDARRVAAHINGIHHRVNGTVGDPSGARYSALDPQLLRWVHATMIDSTLRTFERFVRPISPEFQDQYCNEATMIGPLLGIPVDMLPRTRVELDHYMTGMLVSEAIRVDDTARGLARQVLGLSAGVAGVLELPMILTYRLATVGLLPERIRQEYGFTWSAVHQRLFDTSGLASRTVRPLLPDVVTQWGAARRHRALRKAG